MTNMPKTSRKNPEQVELDMQIDLLVDNELPESDRKALIEKCEKQNGCWRSLAIRFLERQTERRTVRDLIAGKTQESVYEPDTHPIYSFKLPFGLDVRSVAAVLLIAVGAGSMGMYYGQRAINNGGAMAVRPANSGGPSVASIGGGPVINTTPMRAVQFDGPVSAENSPSLDALIAGQSINQNSPHNVIIVPQEHNRALIVPVSLDRTQVIY